MLRKRIYFLITFSLVMAGLIPVSCNNRKERIYTIGVINIVPDLDKTLIGFKDGMTELGYLEGKNIRYLYDGPTTDMSQLPQAASKLVDAKVDLILSITTPATLAVKQATADNGIPVVFMAVTDPLGAGIVDTLQRPGGNITGIAFGIQEARRLEWFVKVAPQIRRIYVPYNPNDKSPVMALQSIQNTAKELGVELIKREVIDPGTLNDAIENIPADADALFLLPDSLVSTRLLDIISKATERNMPVSGANVSTVTNLNVLTSFGFDQFLCGKQAARLADQIFRGIRPEDLPVEIAEFYLAINLETAQVIGLQIPDEILRQANIIIR